MSKVNSLLQEIGQSINESLGERERPKPRLVPTKPRTKTAKPKAAKTAEKTAEQAREGNETSIQLSQIVAEEQYRKSFDDAKIRELADSIESLGLIEPIVVRWDRQLQVFSIVAGERRYRAAKLLGLSSILARIMQLTDSEVAEVQLAENVAREDLNPIELAQAFQDVLERTGRDAKSLAKRIGLNPTTVTRHLKLLTLPEDIQRRVRVGEVSARIAREIARITDEETLRQVLGKIEQEKLTGGEAETLVRTVVGAKKARSLAARGKPTVKRLTFNTAHGTVIVVPNSESTYHHVAEAIGEVAEEVDARIRNNVSLG